MICNKDISIMEFLAKIHKIVSFKPIIGLNDKFIYILFQSQVRALLEFFYNFYLIVSKYGFYLKIVHFNTAAIIV